MKPKRESTIRRRAGWSVCTALVWFAAMTGGAAELPAPAAEARLPAFPGAEGFGAFAKGGRGGRVLEVTNLDDEGPGSFRAAVEAAGPRIVVFRTGGIITLSRSIAVREPYLTIAGQSAPGGGILIRGDEMEIQTHDVVVRGLRWRTGERPVAPNRRLPMLGCIRVSPGHDIIVDHCSMSWSTDKCATVWDRRTYNITYQWCIMSEPLAHAHPKDAEHARAFLLGDYTQNITLHHNLFCHAQYRMPEVKGATTSEIINNVRYNWSIAATLYSDWESHGPIRSNHINNLAIAGPDTPEGAAEHSVQLWPPKFGLVMPAGSLIHVSGDVDPCRPAGQGGDHDVVNYRGVDGVEKYLTASLAIEPSGHATGVAVTIQSALAAGDSVLAQVGAITPARDAVDERILRDVRQRTGRIIGHLRELGPNPYPDLPAGSPPEDADHDGIADDWERAHALDPADPADGGRQAPSGYTWVEEYLNGLIPRPIPLASQGSGR